MSKSKCKIVTVQEFASMSLIPFNLSTAAPTQPNKFANVDLSSLIFTIVASVVGLLWSLFSYPLFTKWCCCKGASVWGKCWEKCASVRQKCKEKAASVCQKCKKKCGKVCEPSSEESCTDRCCTHSKVLCSSNAVVNALTFIHLASKPALIVVNIVYFASLGLHASAGKGGHIFDIIGIDPATDLKANGAAVANFITFIAFIQEILTIVIFPIFSVFQWVCCWKKRIGCTADDRGCSKFMEYWRFGDLSYAFIFAPFSNVDLFYVGGLWYLAIFARLTFYSVTFAVAVIAGLRFIYAILCAILCECASNEDTVELKSYKQLFVDIGLKMVSIAMKLLTCSSGLSTYLKIGIRVDSIGFRAAYFFFTILRGATAMFSLVVTAALLRWAALKDSEQESGSRFSKMLGWLNKYEPHVHVSFFFDMLTYGGLLALNFIIVYGIHNNGFNI